MKKYPDQRHLVQLADHPYTILKGLPTPMLIDLQNREEATEAWMQHAGIWRAKDEKHDPPGTKYTRVRVCTNPERNY